MFPDLTFSIDLISKGAEVGKYPLNTRWTEAVIVSLLFCPRQPLVPLPTAILYSPSFCLHLETNMATTLKTQQSSDHLCDLSEKQRTVNSPVENGTVIFTINFA